jgi:ATP-dependent exoDNAse (exonuclease V) beta subunit
MRGKYKEVLNRNEEERQRILYTACTRPREMLYFL